MKKVIVAAMAMIVLSVQELSAQIFIPTGVPSSTVAGNVYVGIGASMSNPQTNLHIKTAMPNAGLRIEQTGQHGSAIQLWHSTTTYQGHNWSIISTANGMTQGPGKLLFYDYNAPSMPERDRMVLDVNGNLGISVLSPLYRLHLKCGSANDGIRIDQPYGGSAMIGLYNSSGGARNWSLQATGYNSPNGSGNFLLKNETTSAVPFFVDGATTHIGMGTTTPTGGILHIVANQNGSGLCVEHYASGPYDFGVKVKVDNDLTKAMSVFNNGTEVMTIWGTGVINTPKLFAEEVQVVPTALGNPWPDFVFAPNYQLMPLDSVETYYTTHQHLPGVPSQEQVQQEGVNVYDMDAVLLQKIEELTLYIVEQQKEIDELKEQVNK